MRAASAILALALATPRLLHAEGAPEQLALPDLGPAPDFSLISQDGAEVTLQSLRGKVVAVTFIYTWCPDICPMLTDKMARMQDALGAAFGRDVAFVTITFDPERDTPEVLKTYAEAFDADLSGWSFLTGEPADVEEVVHSYGVVALPTANAAIDHSTLTTLIDRHGGMRVQYAGYRFDPEEFREDLLILAAEP